MHLPLRLLLANGEADERIAIRSALGEASRDALIGELARRGMLLLGDPGVMGQIEARIPAVDYPDLYPPEDYQTLNPQVDQHDELGILRPGDAAESVEWDAENGGTCWAALLVRSLSQAIEDPSQDRLIELAAMAAGWAKRKSERQQSEGK